MKAKEKAEKLAKAKARLAKQPSNQQARPARQSTTHPETQESFNTNHQGDLHQSTSPSNSNPPNDPALITLDD